MALDLSKNNLYVEDFDQLPIWETDGKSIQKIKMLLKSYLELDLYGKRPSQLVNLLCN